MIANDPDYPGVVRETLRDLRDNLTNVDKVRSFPTRRACVDILKKMQTAEAYAVLREAKAAITAAMSLGGLTTAEAADTEDLLRRIERAISPYYL